MNIVTAYFNTIMGRMTEMSQRKKKPRSRVLFCFTFDAFSFTYRNHRLFLCKISRQHQR